MKQLTAAFLWILALCAIAGVITGSWWLRERHEIGEEADAPAEAEEREGGILNPAMRELAGLRVEPLAKAVWQPQVPALGHVLDPGPLVSLWNDSSTTTAAKTASKAEVERDRQLFARGGGVSRGALDQAEAMAATDRLKHEAVLHRLRFEWGPLWVEPPPGLEDALLAGTTVMVRAETASSVPLKSPPGRASILIPGRETEPVIADRILSVSSVDSRLQGSAWLLLVSGGPGIPAPGSAVEVSLGTDGEKKTGVLIPADAVVQFEGLNWVFLENREHSGNFERRPVRTDRPLTGGYFADEGFAPGDPVVISASAMLLARETLARTPEEE